MISVLLWIQRQITTVTKRGFFLGNLS